MNTVKNAQNVLRQLDEADNMISVLQDVIRRGLKIDPAEAQQRFTEIRKKLNEKIGGSQKSQHSLGQAADLDIAGIPNPELAKFIQDNLEYDQLILEYWSKKHNDPNNGWVHVSTKKEGCRKSCLAYDGSVYTYLTL